MAKDETLDEEVLGEIKPFQGMMSPGTEIVQGGGVLQRVETAYTTAVAVQKPRSLTTVVKNVLEEARLAKSAFYYKWSVKGKKRTSTIQGGSIDLARSIARNFGNVAVDIIEEPESMTHFRFKAVFIDLESGLNWPRLFRQRKTMDTGMKDKERAEDIIFQIGQSKAQRNAVFQGVPGWLVDKAIEVAEDSEIRGIKDEGIEIARIKVLDFFSQYGAEQDRIEEKVGKKVGEWTERDIADLRASATAIKEGRASVAEIFPKAEEKDFNDPNAGKESDEKPKESKKKAGRPKGSTKKKDEAPPSDSGESDMWEAWRKEWINLRNFDSFKEYFESHLDLIYSAPGEIRMRFAKKFESIFSTELPQDLRSAQILIEANYMVGPDAQDPEKTEGDDKGDGEKVASEGNDKPTDGSSGLSAEEIEDLLNSEIWGELQEIKNKYPSSYLRVTRGETPKTENEVRTVIDEIALMVSRDDKGPPE